ncbi:MAG: FtsX-like permease family protein [Pseudomonadota bacterium]
MIFTALARFLARSPWSSAIALVGITLASVSMVAVHQVSVAIERQTRATSLVELGDYNFFLHKTRVSAAEYFELRRRWLAGGLPQVRDLAPVVDESRFLDGAMVRVVGIDLLVAQVTESMVDSATHPADEVTVSGFDRAWISTDLRDSWRRPADVVSSLPPGTALMDIGAAQELLGYREDRLSYVAVTVTDPLARLKSTFNALAPGIGAGLPAPAPALAEIRAAGFDVVSVAAQNPADQLGKSILFNVGALGMLALVVAWFLIYQVAVSWLRRLWPTLLRLHVLGVPHATLRAWFVWLLGLLGLLGTGAGLWLGAVLADWLLGRIATVPLTQPLDAWVVGKAVLCGVGVCLVGAFMAYRNALGNERGSLCLFALALGVAAWLGYVWPALGLMGGFVSIAASGFLVAVLIWPVLRALKRVAHRFTGPLLLRLSAREIAWFPGDLAVAISGLMLAVATALGIALMVDSFRIEFTQMLERRLSYDWVVRGEPSQLATAQGLVATNYPGARVQAYFGQRSRVNGVQVEVQYTRLDGLESARYAYGGTVRDGEVWIGEQVAQKFGVGRGDQLEVLGSPRRITHVFKSFGDLYPRLLIDSRGEIAGSLDSLAVNGLPPPGLAALRNLGLQVTDQAQIKRIALETFEQTFLITDVLLAIALLVASLGIYIALNALRFNRRSSVPLLSTLGFTSWENVQMDFGRALAVGVFAMLLATPLGIWFAYLLCDLVNPRAFGWAITLHVSWQSVWPPLLLGLVAALIAGVIAPGRKENSSSGVLS